MTQKQNPTTPEALLLIRTKRDRAKAAMDQIVKRFGVISNEPEPGLDVLLEYLTQMVYALELLLKVMSDDWRTPGKTHFGHRVGAMYQDIFGRPHACPDFITALERAILNQKFIYEPADRLLDHVPKLEQLWDELTVEFYRRNWMVDASVQREVNAPPEFVEFLRQHLARFYRGETYRHWPRRPRDQRIQMLTYQIEKLQRELEQIEAGNEAPEETLPQVSERLQREHLNRLQAAASCLEFNSENRNRQFSFGVWAISKVMPGYLG